MRPGRLAHDQPGTLHFRSDLLDFVEHHATDALFSKIPLHYNLVDFNGIGRDLHPDDRNELANQLPEQGACRNLVAGRFRAQEAPHSVVITAFHGPDEEPLTFHDGTPAGRIVACLTGIRAQQIIS